MKNIHTNPRSIQPKVRGINGPRSCVDRFLQHTLPALVQNTQDLTIACVTNRFDDLQTLHAMKGVRLLNLRRLPIDTAAF